jgi:hypothetical protein
MLVSTDLLTQKSRFGFNGMTYLAIMSFDIATQLQSLLTGFENGSGLVSLETFVRVSRPIKQHQIHQAGRSVVVFNNFCREGNLLIFIVIGFSLSQKQPQRDKRDRTHCR